MSWSCVLCDELYGRDPLSARVRGERARPLVESEHFVVLPDLRPITDGHVLIISRFHLSAFSGVPAAYSDELRGLIARARGLLRGSGGDAGFLFEHGPGDGPHPGSCVDHAHLHLIPVS